MIPESHTDQNRVYKKQAKKWIIEVVVISLVGGFINLILSTTVSGLGFVLLSFVVSLGVILVNALLLFRHVDTLVLKRIAQAEGSGHV